MKKTLLGLVVGLVLALTLTLFAGENPLKVAQIIFHGAFGSFYNFGMTLFYATPLIFCGLSVAVAFHAGLFNIGAEGQLNIATLAAASVGLWQGAPSFLAIPMAMLAAVAAGALWAFIPGWLRAKRGSHEVINTIMMNFIAAALISWVVTTKLQNPHSQNPETAPVAPQFFFAPHDPFTALFAEAPVSSAFLLAVLAAIFLWVLLWRTPFGFALRAVGSNEEAAQVAGIPVPRMQMYAMLLAGAFAALVALGEVHGSAGKYRMGFSADYGFIGIAVALLARNHPIGIIFSALLFAALHKGSAELDIETDNITRDLSLVMQALVILSVSAFSVWSLKIFPERKQN